jgi:hypothetical protein
MAEQDHSGAFDGRLSREQFESLNKHWHLIQAAARHTNGD